MATRPLRKLTLALLTAYALVRAHANASAQWSTPYDPDFGPPAASQPSVPPSAATATVVLPALSTAGARFLLLERPDVEHPLEGLPVPSTAATPSFSQFLLEQRPFEVNQRQWNETRELVEHGELPEEEVAVSSVGEEGMAGEYVIAGATTPPKPPAPEVELPTYGTSLSITGRKVIGFTYSEKRFLAAQTTTGRAKSQNLIDIQQQLQLRMQGKVGPKITVNVDYDDTKTNKQDISVVYQGDPNEVVQNASFGDIDLSLPSTEFVSYNKQLFGIRVQLQYKRLSALFIGSRTKGETHSKEFKGNTQFVTQDILDTSYIRFRYYDLTFGDARRLPLVAGSETVYLSVSAGGTQNVNQFTRTVDDLAVPSSTFTGTFVQLARGVDYTVDYVKGILTFRNGLDPNAVVAVNFTDASGVPIAQQRSTAVGTSGGTGLPKLIKTFGDVAIATTTEAGYRRELKTVYSIGANQIVRDDGRGNFFLQVLDQNRNVVGPNLNPPQAYPNTITMDFENGTFQLAQPFGSAGDPSTPDPEVYAPSPLTKRLFHLEYHFRLKTFFLEPNIVLQSETVLVDGQKLARNVDYFIDYESGFLTFFNPERIQTDSTIDVSYEVAPFAGNATDSLLGGRVGYELWKNHWKVGSTLLYDTGSKSPTVPSVTELARSLLVYDADTELTNLRLGSWLTASFGGEVAQSHANPNLNKFALIDNMESVKAEDSATMLATYWHVTPGPTAPGQAAFPDPTGFTISDFDEQTLVINPNAQAKPGDTQKVLSYHYDFNLAQTTETAMVYTLSPTGLDFSQKTVIEIVLEQDSESGNQLAIDLGGFNEDADGTGGQTLTCADGRILTNQPNTEDQNCDGILQPAEDIGWLYHPIGKNSARYGAGNGLLDSEDLNHNGRLDAEDFSGGRFGYDAAPSLKIGIDDVTDPNAVTADANGVTDVLKIPPGRYHTLHISLTSATADTSRWLAIKELRIAVRQGTGGVSSGTIKIARIAVVGNTWQRGVAGDLSTGATAKGGESLEVTAVNNVDNPEYQPRAIQIAGGDATAVFNDLYGSLSQLQQQSNTNNVSEQALQLRYSDLAAGTTVFTKRVFPTALDISQHHYFNFLLFGNAQEASCPGVAQTAVTAADGKTFFLRAGSDSNFFEVRVPMNFCGWKKISVEQRDTNGDQIPDTWFVASAPPGSVALSSGTPNLQQISVLTAGVYSSSGTAGDQAHLLDGEVYLNEIHVAGPITRVGNAEKVQADFSVPGWASFGSKFRFVDRNYQTPTTVVANQDNLQENGYLNLTRLSWLPMSFNVNYSRITTPNTNAVGTLSNVVSLLSQGTVRTWNGTATGTFQKPALPRLTVSHERNRVEYDELSGRLDDRRTYKGALSYSPPSRRFFVPRSVDGDYTYSRYGVTFQTDQSRLTPGNYDSDELTQGFGLKLSFEPWQGSSFAPNYTVSRVRESRQDFTTGSEVDTSYDKSLQQTAGFTSNWRLRPWLKPSVSYTASTIENNILSVSTFTTATSTQVFGIGAIKTVNRNASGNVSLTLAAAELFPKTRLWRSFTLTNSYQLQDGDVWNNVESGLDTRAALWLRTPLHPTNPFAQLVNLTLRDTLNSTQRWSPLEAYDLKGRRAPFKTFSLTNNFVKSIQRSETTGTPSKTIATTLPDLIASMGGLEQVLHAERWAKNMQMNLKYSQQKTENVAISLETDDTFGTDLRAIVKKRFDTSLSFNLRTTHNEDLRLLELIQSTDHKDATLQTTFDVNKYRFTPKFDYQSDVTTLGTGQQSQNTTVLTPSLLVRADLSMPKGLKIPLTNRVLTFTNRVIWTNTVSLAIRQSPVTIEDNSKLLDINSSADYEIAKNLRMTLTGAVSRLWHKYLREEEYIAYQFGTTLTFQF